MLYKYFFFNILQHSTFAKLFLFSIFRQRKLVLIIVSFNTHNDDKLCVHGTIDSSKTTVVNYYCFYSTCYLGVFCA